MRTLTSSESISSWLKTPDLITSRKRDLSIMPVVRKNSIQQFSTQCNIVTLAWNPEESLEE